MARDVGIQIDAADPAGGKDALAATCSCAGQDPGLPGKAAIAELYTDRPEGSTIICADKQQPVIPALSPDPGWSPGGRRLEVATTGLNVRARH